MIKRKLIIVFVAILTAVATLPFFAAFEAHVINVTAHIDNALEVSPQEIDFGNVYPEEVLQDSFTVEMSESFLDEEQTRVDKIDYKLVQKPKPKGDPYATIIPPNFPDGIVAWNYCLNHSDDSDYFTYCYMNLCDYLAKTGEENDTEISALLTKPVDIKDIWTLTLTVPCIEGYCPQDEEWPRISEVGDYGCDIWVEVTDISKL